MTNNTPSLRFKGFAGAWEQRNLSELSSVRTGFPFDSKTFDDNGRYLVITNGNIQDDDCQVNNGIGNRVDIDESKVLKEYILNVGDILVTMDGNVGRVAKVAHKEQILAQRVGRLTSYVNGEFLFQLLRSGSFSASMTEASHGGTIKHISLKDISTFGTQVPTNETERKQIGDCLFCFDQFITLRLRKLEKLMQLKYSLLTKMFPSTGAVMPALRFKGFVKAWEQRKLGDSVIMNRFLQIGAEELESLNTGNGDVTLLPSSRNYDWKCNSNDVDQTLINDAEIITVGRARNANTKYSNGKFIASQSHIIESFNKNKLDTKYLYYFISKHEKEFYSAESTYPMFTKQDFDEIKLFYSKELDEQHKIARLFTNLENIIALHQRKLGLLKSLKSSLLFKMFPN